MSGRYRSATCYHSGILHPRKNLWIIISNPPGVSIQDFSLPTKFSSILTPAGHSPSGTVTVLTIQPEPEVRPIWHVFCSAPVNDGLQRNVLMSLLWSVRSPLWLFIFGTALFTAAENLAGADDQPGFQVAALALQHARVVTEPGHLIEDGTILVRDGRIEAVGSDVTIPPDAETVDLQGLTVYAGFMDAASSALIDSSVALPTVTQAPVDASRQPLISVYPDEHSGLTPQWSVGSAMKWGKGDLDKFRQAGFCLVHVTPTGRILSGQSACLLLDGRPPREAMLAPAVMMTVRLWDRHGGEYPSTLMGAFAHLRQHFADAERHALQQKLYETSIPGIEAPPVDPVWTAMQGLRNGPMRSLFEVETRDDVERARRLVSEYQLRPVYWGGRDAAKTLPLFGEESADWLLALNWGEEPKADKGDEKSPFPHIDDPQTVLEWKRQQWRDRVATAVKLQAAGHRVGWSTEGLKSPNDLWGAIKQLTAQGMKADAILASLTTQPAAILGLDQQLGRIAPGLLANFTITTGPLEHEQTKVRYVIVRGERFEFNKDANPLAPSAMATPAPELAGTWEVTIESDDTPLPGTLTIHSSGSGFAGRFESGQGSGLIQNGRVSGSQLDFEIAIGAGDRSVVLKFSGQLQDDTLTGTVKSPFGSPAAFTAKRRPENTAQSTGPVQMETIEGVDEADGPVSAVTDVTKPTESKTATRPLEFPDDRKARPLTTQGNVFIKGGTIITGLGTTLEQQSLLIKEGKIAAIGPDLQPEPEMTVIDATGRWIMPGIIDTHSHIMISNGLGGVNEATHSIVCEVRVQDTINTHDAQEYRAAAGGVTTIRLLHGSANVIGGQDAVVQLKHGATAAEHLLPRAHSGVKFALGENVKFRRGRFPNTRLGVEATLQRAFIEALEYRRDWQQYEQLIKEDETRKSSLLPPRHDLRLEALADILSQEKFIHSHCYRSDEILMLLRVANQHGLRVWSLQHVLEGYKVAPEIVAHGASCSTFADWWAYKVEAYDATPYNAALLHEAGANVVIKSDNDELMRHLNQEAAKTVRYGNLPAEQALSLVTLNPARELGIEDRVGSIEVGKQADLAIYNGHPLNTFARCELTLIAGEPVFVREKQPTAMSTAGLEHSAKPREVHLPAASDRKAVIDWPNLSLGRYALINAQIHPVDGPTIEHGVIVIEDGKITTVSNLPAIPADVQVVNLDGLQVYPGLIDSGTTAGITEIGKVVETHDYDETGVYQPDLRAGVAINPDSELIPVARAGGITTALIRPTSGVISGQSSVMTLAGWTAPEMVLVDACGLQIHWPGYKNNKDQVEQLRDWLKQARVYDAARSAAAEAGGLDRVVDPRYEALRPYVRGEKPVFIEAQTEQQLVEAIKFAELEKLKIVLCGASDAWKVADQLKSKEIPVIVGPVMREPTYEFDPYDATYANPGRLQEAGVKFAIRSDNASNSRNAPFEAGMAVAFGLPEEAALRSVTLAAAEILGIADQCGSITPGKRADLVILDGSPLQVTSQVKGVIIGGKPFRPESRQTRLYEKYRQRVVQP
ncbi:amidohydrolase family protein [bacterium]|nr:amidohydrolase family protein [bacterium]